MHTLKYRSDRVIAVAGLCGEAVIEKPYITEDQCDYAYVPTKHVSRCHKLTVIKDMPNKYKKYQA